MLMLHNLYRCPQGNCMCTCLRTFKSLDGRKEHDLFLVHMTCQLFAEVRKAIPDFQQFRIVGSMSRANFVQKSLQLWHCSPEKLMMILHDVVNQEGRVPQLGMEIFQRTCFRSNLYFSQNPVAIESFFAASLFECFITSAAVV